MRYNGDQLNMLADKIDIVDYIGQTEEIHKNGHLYYCCCPFHKGDDTPSLCIYPDTHSWYCYGCGAGSSIYDWVMHKDNISFQEAVKKLSLLVDLPLEEAIESESINFLKQLRKNKKSSDVIIRKTLDFTEDYLKKYSDELPQEWLDEDMTEEALKTYNIRIDHNANRIVYPVFDSNNNMIGVKGRTRLSSYKELKIPKYINYYKINTIDYFQGWQQAIPEIQNSKTVIIFEGVKSCIKAWGWGIRNTIAAETSKLSEGQLQLLIKNQLHEVIIGLDSDQSFQSIISNDKIKMLQKFTQVSIIRDRHKLLGDKMSPVDRGEQVFRQLLKEKIKLWH